MSIKFTVRKAGQSSSGRPLWVIYEQRNPVGLTVKFFSSFEQARRYLWGYRTPDWAV